MEPQSYVASRAATEDAINVVPRAPISRIEGDPLRSFDTFHFKVQADLRGWMTFAVDDRIARLREYENLSPREVESYRLDHDRLHKILCYVIWMESSHAHGERKVAALAFNILFPKS